MKPIFETYFQNYKNVLNSFIVKIAGDKSEFALHQDSTSCDESKYSPLSLWIPLQDTNIDNGTLCVVPKTHQVFSNYRGVSIQPDYYKYEEEIRKYLMPIQLKAGDILVFDNRLVHYSPANKSKNDRIVVMCGLFDKEATFRICYQENKNEPIDIYHQADDFFIDI
jgi:ectoine hydroxylase-related dioxygenase (phytanoyl-CoA dioxygenase family)